MAEGLPAADRLQVVTLHRRLTNLYGRLRPLEERAVKFVHRLLSVNKFFEPTVRIQADRGQTVIDTGPYAIVRHPGYFSGFPIFVGMALALGSLWALIP